MKNADFLDAAPCGSCKDRRFGGTYRLDRRVIRIGELRTTLTVTINRSTLRTNAEHLWDRHLILYSRSLFELLNS
jgi:hypothetical protein